METFMEIVLCIVGVIVVAFICKSVSRLFNSSSEADNMTNDPSKTVEELTQETRSIVMDSLRQIGCQPELNPDKSVDVQYQGENFVMLVRGRYVRIWDLFWSYMNENDPDLPKAKEAINDANYNFGATVVVSDPEDGKVAFHSRCDIMLHPSCDDNADFLRATLDSFFNTKDNVKRHYAAIEQEQQVKQRNRRPMGFAINRPESNSEASKAADEQ